MHPQQFSEPMLSVLEVLHRLLVEFCILFFRVGRLSVNHTDLQTNL